MAAMRLRVGGGLGLFHQRGAFGIGREHDLEQRLLCSRRFLRDLADAQPLRQFDRTAFGRQVAGDEFEQRRLAGAVAPDEADFHAFRNDSRRALEQRPAHHAEGEIGDLKHAGLVAESRRNRKREGA